MSKNPYLNGLGAVLYVSLISSLMFFLPEYLGEGPDTILAPIFMLSLFVFSAAIMGYIFLGQPLQMYLDGQKQESVRLFLMTALSFAVIAAVLSICLFILLY